MNTLHKIDKTSLTSITTQIMFEKTIIFICERAYVCKNLSLAFMMKQMWKKENAKNWIHTSDG